MSVIDPIPLRWVSSRTKARPHGDRSALLRQHRLNSMPVSVDPQYSVAGLVVGLLVGQTGMGGGALMTPDDVRRAIESA